MKNKWRDAGQWQRVGQVPGHGVAGGRLVHGQRDAVAEGYEPGERGCGGRPRRRNRKRNRGRRPPRDVGEGAGRQRHARRGGRRRDDSDCGDHADRQPDGHAAENDRETEKADAGRGKRTSRIKCMRTHTHCGSGFSGVRRFPPPEHPTFRIHVKGPLILKTVDIKHKVK